MALSNMTTTGKHIQCNCGKLFATTGAMEQHTRKSLRHVQTMQSPTGSSPPADPSSEDTQRERIQCACGKAVKSQNGLENHARMSSHCREFHSSTTSYESGGSVELPVIRNVSPAYNK